MNLVRAFFSENQGTFAEITVLSQGEVRTPRLIDKTNVECVFLLA